MRMSNGFSSMDKLDTITLAKLNIQRKPVRSVSLAVLTFALAFTLFTGSFLVKSLEEGLSSLSNRLGADIIVVPQGYDSKIEGALLRGEPNNFYFERTALDVVRSIDGVEKASPQLFVATLSAGCCSFPLQVIGLDFDSDFCILPWLKQHVKFPLKDNQIIVGANIVGNYNSELKFFNQPFAIAGRLSKTGMGFDNSVFMSVQNAQRLIKEYERIMQHPASDNENLISSIMVRVKSGSNIMQVAQKIRSAFKGQQLYPLAAKNMMSNVASAIENLSFYIYILTLVLWILTVLVLFPFFSSIINERKKEFAMLTILGATKKKIVSLAFTEALVISGGGAAGGSMLALCVVLLFNQAFSQAVKLPYLRPHALWICGLFLIVTLLVSATGPIASLKMVRQFSKAEDALNAREE